MDPQKLLEQFLGPDAKSGAAGAMDKAKGALGGGLGTFAAGGLLGALLGNKKARKKVSKLAGGVVGYGGAAALGALAFRAYQNWQSGQQGPEASPAPQAAPAAPALPPPLTEASFEPGNAPAKDGHPFELGLIKAMIAAANADGHIDSDEQRLIFDRVGQLPLAAEDKAFVFDALGKPPSLHEVAALAEGPEQATELYLVSRLAIDPDHPMEQAYLEALANRLSLPRDLVDHLEAEAAKVV